MSRGHFRSKPYDFELRIDSNWTTGFQFSIIIRNHTNTDFANVSFLLFYSGAISWMSDLEEEKVTVMSGVQMSRVRPMSYLPVIGAKKEHVFNLGIQGELRHLYIRDLQYETVAVVRPLDKTFAFIEDAPYRIEGVMNYDNNAAHVVDTRLIGDALELKKREDRWVNNGNVIVNGTTMGVFMSGETKKRPFVGTLADDTPNSLSFFQQSGHLADSRYIYLNGGPKWGGWRYNYATEEKYLATPQIGSRAIKYLQNSKRLGMQPCFVYYTINNGSDSFSEITKNMNSAEFMRDYREDILALCDIINTHWNDVPSHRVRIILEPDFIGYICQNANAHPLQIPAVPLIENYANNLYGLVTSVVDLFRNNCPLVEVGWQFNVWSTYTAGKSYAGGRGLMNAWEVMGEEPWRVLMRSEALQLATFASHAGCMHNVDFICFDKYGLDAGFEKKLPQQSNWFWRYDTWRCYIEFAHQVSKYMNNLPIILWQIPVGHISDGDQFTILNNTNNRFECSAASFFFGQKFRNNPNDQKLQYLSQYARKDFLVMPNGDYTTWSPFYPYLSQHNILGVYFGAGVGISTSHTAHTFLSAPTDGGYLIEKMRDYITAPVVINTPP